MATGGAPPLTIMIPLGGIGSRFQREGYTSPKPFVNVLGKACCRRRRSSCTPRTLPRPASQWDGSLCGYASLRPLRVCPPRVRNVVRR